VALLNCQLPINPHYAYVSGFIAARSIEVENVSNQKPKLISSPLISLDLIIGICIWLQACNKQLLHFPIKLTISIGLFFRDVPTGVPNLRA
jgi:hypothetical protein